MSSQVVASAVISGLLGLTLVVTRYDDHRPPDRLAAPLESIPTQIMGWQRVQDEVLPDDILKNLKATSYLSRNYRRASMQLNFFTAFYATRSAGETLHTPKNCLPGNGWEILKLGHTQLDLGDHTVPINEYTIQRDSSRAIALYWYQTPDRVIANEYAGKMYLFWDSLTRGRKSASAVRVVVPDI